MGDFWAQFIMMKVESINQIIDNINNGMLSYFKTTFEGIRSATDENFKNLQGSVDENIEFYRRFITTETEKLAASFISQSVALEEDAAISIAQIEHGDNSETSNRMKLKIHRKALDFQNRMTQYIESHRDSLYEDLATLKNGITVEIQTKKQDVSTNQTVTKATFEVSMNIFTQSAKEELDSLFRRFGNQAGRREGLDSIKNFTDELLGKKWSDQFSLMLHYLDKAGNLIYENIIRIQDVQKRTFQNSQIFLKLRYAHTTSFTMFNNFFITVENIIHNHEVPDFPLVAN